MRAFKQSIAVVGLASLAVLPLAGQGGSGMAKPAQAGGEHAMAHSGKLAAADSKFVHEAAMGGMAEVDLGKLAADKASSPDVKQFGQRMVEDHGKANDELKALAAQKGVTLPTAVDPAHKAVADKLAKLSGAAFDKAYMQDMVKDHDKDVAAFKHASTSAADADLKAWAGKTLPTLQEHQTQAKSINSSLGAAGGAMKKPGTGMSK